MRGLERTRKFFFVLKSLVPTQSSQDKEKLTCPFQSTDTFPEWKLAFRHRLYTFQARSHHRRRKSRQKHFLKHA
jgi:hypothetical protein